MLATRFCAFHGQHKHHRSSFTKLLLFLSTSLMCWITVNTITSVDACETCLKNKQQSFFWDRRRETNRPTDQWWFNERQEFYSTTVYRTWRKPWHRLAINNFRCKHIYTPPTFCQPHSCQQRKPSLVKGHFHCTSLSPEVFQSPPIDHIQGEYQHTACSP